MCFSVIGSSRFFSIQSFLQHNSSGDGHWPWPHPGGSKYNVVVVGSSVGVVAGRVVLVCGTQALRPSTSLKQTSSSKQRIEVEPTLQHCWKAFYLHIDLIWSLRWELWMKKKMNKCVTNSIKIKTIKLLHFFLFQNLHGSKQPFYFCVNKYKSIQ